MPTYQYRCPTCGHEFEEFQAMSDEPIRICPACQGETHRVISGGIGLIFKGTGFYITDYKKKSGGDGCGKESTASKSETPSTKSETGSSKSSDGKAKPAAPSKD